VWVPGKGAECVPNGVLSLYQVGMLSMGTK